MLNIHVEEYSAEPTGSAWYHLWLTKLYHDQKSMYQLKFLFTNTSNPCSKNPVFWWFLGLPMTSIPILKDQDEPKWSIRYPLWLYYIMIRKSIEKSYLVFSVGILPI